MDLFILLRDRYLLLKSYQMVQAYLKESILIRIPQKFRYFSGQVYHGNHPYYKQKLLLKTDPTNYYGRDFLIYLEFSDIKLLKFDWISATTVIRFSEYFPAKNTWFNWFETTTSITFTSRLWTVSFQFKNTSTEH